MTEKLEIVVARIDENVKHIKKEIKCIKDNCDTEMEDHEKRIRDNERFKNRGYGALGIISAVLGIITLIVWGIVS